MKRIYEPEEYDKDLKHVEKAFGVNGFLSHDIKRAINPKKQKGKTAMERT